MTGKPSDPRCTRRLYRPTMTSTHTNNGPRIPLARLHYMLATAAFGSSLEPPCCATTVLAQQCTYRGLRSLRCLSLTNPSYKSCIHPIHTTSIHAVPIPHSLLPYPPTPNATHATATPRPSPKQAFPVWSAINLSSRAPQELGWRVKVMLTTARLQRWVARLGWRWVKVDNGVDYPRRAGACGVSVCIWEANGYSVTTDSGPVISSGPPIDDTGPLQYQACRGTAVDLRQLAFISGDSVAG
ncbi:hypothetical protein EDC01DRAFT_745253 [Geopyxis carbonaria]|nr:hypothetical protein EDC01DRAFT_745253 [Geopyxis carbonaria]